MTANSDPGPLRLAAYVGLTAAQAPPLVVECWDEATALVTGWTGEVEIPATVRTRAVVEVGAELYHRKNTKNGISQFASPDGTAVRIGRDPLAPAYPILRPFLGGGFA